MSPAQSPWRTVNFAAKDGDVDMGKTGSGFLCQDEVLVGQIGLERRGYVARLTPQSKALKGAAEAVNHLTVLIEVEVFAVDGRRFHYLALNAQKRASPCKLHLAHGQLVYAAQVAGNACEQIPEPSRRPAAHLAIKEKLLPVGNSRPALSTACSGQDAAIRTDDAVVRLLLRCGIRS